MCNRYKWKRLSVNDWKNKLQECKSNLDYLEMIISIINDFYVILIYVGKSKLDDWINTSFNLTKSTQQTMKLTNNPISMQSY